MFSSSVGDESVNLPPANAILQLTSTLGKSVQQIQRGGRVQRLKDENPKRIQPDRNHANVYVLHGSQGTSRKWSDYSREFVRDRGFETIQRFSRQTRTTQQCQEEISAPLWTKLGSAVQVALNPPSVIKKKEKEQEMERKKQEKQEKQESKKRKSKNQGEDVSE